MPGSHSRFVLLFLLLTLLSLLQDGALALPLNSPLLPSYDYIVVGGGPAGLTVANRLSEDPSVTVLLLEAGPPSDNSPETELPGLIGDDIGGPYDWNLSTVPQIYLDGAPRSIPQGHVLGGGTILNGMLWNRGGQGDYADWVALGNEGWSWEDLLPYFMRSETFTPESNAELAAQFSIQEYAPVHGFSGPVNVSYPRYFWTSSAMLFSALNEAGVPTAFDPNTGWVAGASFLPLDLDPVSEERSDAAKAYYFPYAGRANLWVSTGLVVTQVLFANGSTNSNASSTTPGDASIGQGDSPGIPGGIYGGATTQNASSAATTVTPRVKRHVLNHLWVLVERLLSKRQTSSSSQPSCSLVATGVEFAVNAQSQRQSVSANREVIIAAGALHSPQLLLLSGIGPAAGFHDLDIPVNVDLPGVGNNLQDHGRVWCWYPYTNASFPNPTELTNNITFATDALTEYWENRTGPYTAAAVDGVAFPSLPSLINGSNALSSTASAQSTSQYLPPNLDPSLVAGYAAQHTLLTSALSDPTRAVSEILNGNDGVLSVANMRPFSRGSVTINSSDPFTPPIIDPRYGSNPLDISILQAAIAFNTRLLSTPSLSTLEPVQVYPPSGATEAQVETWIDTKLQTEYHPAGTCAMMPFELGGVVSPELLVYGTRNLRVVDSSVMPMLPAAHLQAVVYGVAEKAADIIKAAWVSGSDGASGVEGGDGEGSSSSSLQSATSSASLSAGAAPAPPTLTTFVTVLATQTVYAS